MIYQAEVIDPERYEHYRTKAAESILAAGGRYLARGGEIDVLEGEPPPSRTVVLEFPTRQAAIDWYRGEEYTSIRRLRDSAAQVRLYIVDGVG
jgi:uncharacterized protein (DUF1330 family)